MPVADFMASLFAPLPKVVRLLDAGAGSGSLTAAFVSRLCEHHDTVRKVEATLFEIDPLIQDSLLDTLADCERTCEKAGIQFAFKVHQVDFIQEMSARLTDNLFGTPPVFDVAIVNPPYRKIGTASPERRSLRQVGIETSNLYAGFIALIHRLLVPGGQLAGHHSAKLLQRSLFSFFFRERFPRPFGTAKGFMFLNHAARRSGAIMSIAGKYHLSRP